MKKKMKALDQILDDLVRFHFVQTRVKSSNPYVKTESICEINYHGKEWDYLKEQDPYVREQRIEVEFYMAFRNEIDKSFIHEKGAIAEELQSVMDIISAAERSFEINYKRVKLYLIENKHNMNQLKDYKHKINASASISLHQGFNKIDYGAITNVIRDTKARFDMIKRYVEAFMTLDEDRELENTDLPILDYQKLQWNGSVSLLAYLFLELANKGYIGRLPVMKGETNFQEYGRMVMQLIDIPNSSQNYVLDQFLESKNKLSDKGRANFNFPNITDLN